MKIRKQNRNRKVDKRADKRRGMNRHHLVNKCKGGKDDKWNIAVLDIERHRYWHRVFGNKSLEEVIELLLRFKRLKDYQRTCPP